MELELELEPALVLLVELVLVVLGVRVWGELAVLELELERELGPGLELVKVQVLVQILETSLLRSIELLLRISLLLRFQVPGLGIVLLRCLVLVLGMVLRSLWLMGGVRGGTAVPGGRG